MYGSQSVREIDGGFDKRWFFLLSNRSSWRVDDIEGSIQSYRLKSSLKREETAVSSFDYQRNRPGGYAIYDNACAISRFNLLLFS